MENSKGLKATLLFSGLIAATIGGAILIAPVAFHATSGIDLTGNIDLLSEIRAPGGSLLAGGILVMSGAFVDRLRLTALIVSVILYLSYGLSRLVGMVLDGMPGDVLVAVTFLEISIGLVCLNALSRYGSKEALRYKVL